MVGADGEVRVMQGVLQVVFSGRRIIVVRSSAEGSMSIEDLQRGFFGRRARISSSSLNHSAA
jgi:hypothetical protein